jgi:hypothetical protein
MTVDQPNVVDFVSYNSNRDCVTLTMVEHRPWGSDGQLLLDLQAKASTYLTYALDGQLIKDYPHLSGKRVEFCLAFSQPPGCREREFIDILKKRYLEPDGIGWCEMPVPSQ